MARRRPSVNLERRAAIAAGASTFVSVTACDVCGTYRMFVGGGCAQCKYNKKNEVRRNKYKSNPIAVLSVYRAKREADPIRFMLYHVRQGAKKRNLEFAITPSDVYMGTHCPCCNHRFEKRQRNKSLFQQPHLPTIDRKNSLVGYVPGNVAVICWRCNDLKSNATLDELECIVSWMKSHSQVKET